MTTLLYPNPKVDHTLRDGTTALPFVTATGEGFAPYASDEAAEFAADRCATAGCTRPLPIGWQAENGETFCVFCVTGADTAKPPRVCVLCGAIEGPVDVLTQPAAGYRIAGLPGSEAIPFEAKWADVCFDCIGHNNRILDAAYAGATEGTDGCETCAGEPGDPDSEATCPDCGRGLLETDEERAEAAEYQADVERAFAHPVFEDVDAVDPFDDGPGTCPDCRGPYVGGGACACSLKENDE